MFAEIGVPLLAALFLEIDALVIAMMIAAFFLHEATAIWDVSYASKARLVSPLEQHVHSFLERIPLMALLLVVTRHFGQATALLGFGEEPPRFDLAWKAEPLPTAYVVSVLLLALVFDLLPFVEELARGLRANGGRLTPEPARRAERAGEA
jgi:hypothetical protein